jgi:hypothetical protein
MKNKYSEEMGIYSISLDVCGATATEAKSLF